MPSGHVSPSLLALCLFGAGATAAEPTAVAPDPATLPVVRQVDVAIAGGSTGAVAAALAAAEAGATVFLATPYPYLGEDVTATLRLWLEDGEAPTTDLVRRLFTDTPPSPDVPGYASRLPFTYSTTPVAGGRHPDTTPPSRLTDGQWGSAASQSAEYSGGGTVALDLGQPRAVRQLHVLAYHNRDFQVGAVQVRAQAADGTWSQVGELRSLALEQTSDTGPAALLTVPLTVTAQHLAVQVTPATDSTRILLGEIVVVGDSPAAATPEPPAPRTVRPLHVKRVLEEAMLAAGVDFYFGAPVVAVRRDAAGGVCGFEFVTRGGRQAVLAKQVVDATEHAVLARLAGARFRPAADGPYTFSRVVIGGPVRSGPEIVSRSLPSAFRPPAGGTPYPVTDYALRLPLPDRSWRSLAAAEQTARDQTVTPEQQVASDALFEVPPTAVVGRLQVSAADTAPGELSLDACRPAGMERLWILGGAADVPREVAARLVRPPALGVLATRLGTTVARAAKAIPAQPTPAAQAPPATPPASGTARVRIPTGRLRPGDGAGTVPADASPFPVLGSWDVVVVGGGTAGAPAGIAAARRGARTLVVEALHGLGGVGTLGAITKYYWGYRGGFTKEVAGGADWQIEQKMEWWRQTLRSAGAEVWFGCLGGGSVVDADGKRVVGVLVLTPMGPGVALAGTVVDATGSADVAAAAGAPCQTTDADDLAVQGTGLPPRRLGTSYTNTDFAITDDNDPVDVRQLVVAAKARDRNAFDLGPLLDTRERRRIVGEVTLTIVDELLGRTYPDTVAQAYSNFDSHGYTTDPLFALAMPSKDKGVTTFIPYRALLPRGLDGLLVAGLGASAHRDAIPLIRMQPDLQNQGYAAGAAAAMAAKLDGRTRQIDLRALQEHLVKIGNLPDSVLTATDPFPLPSERLREAVAKAVDGVSDVPVLFASPDIARPLLRDAFLASQDPAVRLAYARILAVLGDATGLDLLVAKLQEADRFDAGWNYRAMGQFGNNLSPVDVLIYALGRTRDRRATDAVLAKVRTLEPAAEFSHFRAVALALESLADPKAAAPLAELLAKPGMRGHAMTTLDQAVAEAKQYPSWTATEPRRQALIEIMLARALYRCGDHDGLGRRILEEYARDLRGHFARHAQAVLAVEPDTTP